MKLLTLGLSKRKSDFVPGQYTFKFTTVKGRYFSFCNIHAINSRVKTTCEH